MLPLIPDVNLVPLPDSVDFVAAASLGCRFATAFRALTAHRQLGPGDWLAVHECGGVGLSAVMIASALGPRVVAVDVADAALDRARDLGAEAVVEGRVPDPAATICEITQGGARCPSMRWARRPPRWPRCAAFAAAADTSRLVCCSAPHPRRRFRWTWSLRGNWRSTARMEWPHEYPPMLALVANGTPPPGPAARKGHRTGGGRNGAGRDGPTVGEDNGDRAAA